MLRNIRKASSGWVGKSIMIAVVGLLVIAFAIWGIGDIFRGFGRSTVAKIGGTEITTEQFRVLFNERLQRLSRQLRRPISLDQARALGLDRQLVGQLIAETVLDIEAHRMGLGLSDATIAKRITSDPSFQGVNGQFDRTRFQLLIREAGYTEQRYVAEQRRVGLRRQLAQTIAGQPHVPKTTLVAVNRYQNEERGIEYIALGSAAAGDIPAPTPEQLAKYFQDHKVLFRAPEYRKVVTLLLTPDELAPWIKVSDADAKQYYEAHRDKYITPEKRHVQQILLPDAAAAQAAAERIAKGETFEALAKDPKLKEHFTDLGTVAKKDMFDPAIAAAAFALKPGGVSGPVKGRFGTAIVHVLTVEPEVVRTFQQVAPQITIAIARDRAKDQVLKTYDKIEDERAAGHTLSEIATKLKLNAKTFEFDRSGKGPDGKPVSGLPKFVNLVQATFTSDVGVENDPLQKDSNYVWYAVTGINPAHDRKLEEVKSEVETHWREDEIAKRLKAKTDAMVGKLKAGGKLAELAGEGVKVETATGLKRGKPTKAVPATVIDAVFHTANGGPGSAQGDKPTTRFVYVVKDVKDPKLDMKAPDITALDTALNQALSDELLGQYVARLESEIGVKINQAALAQAIGATSN
jgi:peptidyl-prolyl cis-trans isomerase D